ncbi:hypothetical protein D3C85_1093180 [compost metagenome]
MQISKTTLNYASKRNIEVVIEEGIAFFYESDNDCEPMFTYNVESDGLHYKGNIYLKQEVKEELPAWIKDEKHLRQVIDFLAKNI